MPPLENYEYRDFWEIEILATKENGEEKISVIKTITRWARLKESVTIEGSLEKSIDPIDPLDHNHPHWLRISRTSQPLPFKIVDEGKKILVDENGKILSGNGKDVYAENGLIRFSGTAYILIPTLKVTPNIAAGPLGVKLKNSKNKNEIEMSPNLEMPEELSHLVTGETIRLEISFCTPSSSQTESTTDPIDSGLFYLEQSPNQGVSLSDSLTFNPMFHQTHIFTFSISDLQFSPLPYRIIDSNIPDPPLVENLTNIRIIQDLDRYQSSARNNTPYFECYAEQVPLVMLRATDPIKAHSFDKDHQELSVGYVPGKKIFKGAIGRVFFDPNSSCTSC